ncbi:hypothetical protein JOM56_005375 [Amanita muscaria]|uniref:Tyrosinase C-terminal domain-containing protein n=1 Tax=Amanita muscaria (strain Koide BX008) TaxID=946122 RepID=A0A0C2WN91_AMAMK|nr:hypothetical protein M378DRAFT_164943 [Amanita muscaria Koide BX008]
MDRVAAGHIISGPGHSKNVRPNSQDQEEHGQPTKRAFPRSIYDINADRPDIHQWHNWTARIRVKKFQFGSTFSVLIFLGDVPPQHTQWKSSDNLVGTHHVYATSLPPGGDSGIINEGFIHLNLAILRKREDEAKFDPGEIKPYLRENLNWRTADLRSEPIEISSLEVTVVSTLFSKVPGARMPASSDRRTHHDITFGRPGGATDRTTD